MKIFLKNTILILIIFSTQNCNSQEIIDTNLKLCDINNSRSLNLLKLKKIEPPISKENVNGREFLTKKFNYPEQSLNFTIHYNAGDVIIGFNEFQYTFGEGKYFRVYERNYSKGLAWMDFGNYLLELSGKKYLICRTYPNYNEATAFNNIFFVIQIDDDSKSNYFSFGSYGYCSNIFGDYNNDGILDFTLIDFISPLKGERLDYESPKGIFTAQAYSFNKGKFSSLKNEEGEIKCKYTLSNNNEITVEGNWYPAGTTGNN